MFPGRHWQQICCSSRLYDGLFGEGSLRASANQARVLTSRPGLLEFKLVARLVCAQRTSNNARHLFFHIAVACALVYDTCTIPFSPRLRHTFTLESRRKQLQRVASRFQRHLHQPHSFAFNQHGVPRWYVHLFTVALHRIPRYTANRLRNLRYQASRLPGYPLQE